MLNYTPHQIVLILAGGSRSTCPSVGKCRVKSTQRFSHLINFSTHPPEQVWLDELPDSVDPQGFIVTGRPEWEAVEWDGPEPEKGENVIVSTIAAQPLADARPDLTIYVPDTGPNSCERDEGGNITGIRRLILWHRPKRGEAS